MKGKLRIFEDNYILNKTELIYSLNKMIEHYKDPDNEEGFSQQKLQVLTNLVTRFIELIDKANLPTLNKWWFY